MDVVQVNKLWQTIRRRPIRTSLALLFILVLVLLGKWGSGFLGEKGRQAASSPNQSSENKPEQIITSMDQKGGLTAGDVRAGRDININSPPITSPLPQLKLYFDEYEANDLRIDIEFDKDGSFIIPNMHVRNTGNTGAIFRIRLFFSNNVLINGVEDLWSLEKNTEPGFPSQIVLNHEYGSAGYSVGPGETSQGFEFRGRISGNLPAKMKSKISVFSNQQEPVSATFKIMAQH